MIHNLIESVSLIPFRQFSRVPWAYVPESSVLTRGAKTIQPCGRGTHGGFDTVNGFVRGAIQEALEASFIRGRDHNSLRLVLELNWWISTGFGVIAVWLLRSWLWGEEFVLLLGVLMVPIFAR